MIKKIFFILILNGIMFSLQAMEPVEDAMKIFTILENQCIRLEDEGHLSFFHALQNRKLSLQKKEKCCDCGEEEIYYIVPHFNDPHTIYEFSLAEIAETFSNNKDSKEKLYSLFPTVLANEDESIQPYLEAYATFLANTDLSRVPWHESEIIMQNRAELINAIAGKDVSAIEAALKLKVQPEKITVTDLITYLKTIYIAACPIM